MAEESWQVYSSSPERGIALGQLVRRAAAEDTSLELPGVVWLEHLNIVVGERSVAEAFYFGVLGLTLDSNGRDANVGQQQFHINNGAVTGESAQTIAGSIGLALPDLDGLRTRLRQAPAKLDGTFFAWADHTEFIVTRCPWGNVFLIWDCMAGAGAADEGDDIPKMQSLHSGIDQTMAVRRGPCGTGGAGIRFVEFKCSDPCKVAHFYEQLFDCRTLLADSRAAVAVGPSVHLIFSHGITDDELERQKGIHICIYITNFRRAYEELQRHGLIWTNPRFRHLDRCDSYEEAAASRQFRFKQIVATDSSDTHELLELEHETRTVRHFQFMKHINWSNSAHL